MILVGLTGGIASGKSTVSDFLRQEGAYIVDADQIAHETILKGNSGYQPVVDFFGREILDAKEEIDRKKLGQIVFNDTVKLNRLNQIVHPLVFECLALEKRKIKKTHPESVVVFDAPLLIEANAHHKMDWVLLVYVDRKTQLARLIRREGLTKAEAEKRIDAQIPIDEKIPFANEKIDNRKPIETVREEVHAIYARLRKKA